MKVIESEMVNLDDLLHPTLIAVHAVGKEY